MIYGKSTAFGPEFHQYKGKWVVRSVNKDEILYQVYDKYKDGKLTNLIFECNDIMSMALMVKLLTEECDAPVVEDLKTEYIY